MSLRFDIIGAGIAAPGLPDWQALEDALAGSGLCQDRQPAPSSLLSPRERRRAPRAAKLSFAAAEQACAMAGMAPGEPVAVFSSAMGDLDITDYMCRTLADDPALLSPIRFHNSVHNAASGYWSIGAGATGDVTAVSAWKDSATAGLIEALARLAGTPDPVLLVVYDDLAQGPMRELWPTSQEFSGALLLAPPGHDRAIASLIAEPVAEPADHGELPAVLIERIKDNPAAELLPLLALVARPGAAVTLAAEQGPGLRISRITA